MQTGLFTLKQIKAATNAFDSSNKIGEGGFGPVFKVFLPIFQINSHLNLMKRSAYRRLIYRVNWPMVLL